MKWWELALGIGVAFLGSDFVRFVVRTLFMAASFRRQMAGIREIPVPPGMPPPPPSRPPDGSQKRSRS